MFMRQSTLAVAAVIALSAAAATAQVFASSEEAAAPLAFVSGWLQPVAAEAGDGGQRLALVEKVR